MPNQPSSYGQAACADHRQTGAMLTGAGTVLRHPRFAQLPDSLIGHDPVLLLTWVTDRLADLGITVTGPPGWQRERHWSTVQRVPTDHGDVWLKANAAGFAHEAGLLGLIAARAPGVVLAPLLTDADQRRLVPLVVDAARLGTPDQRGALITDLLLDLVRAARDQRVHGPHRLTRQEGAAALALALGWPSWPPSWRPALCPAPSSTTIRIPATRSRPPAGCSTGETP
jgi:hypothetical protein